MGLSSSSSESCSWRVKLRRRGNCCCYYSYRHYDYDYQDYFKWDLHGSLDIFGSNLLGQGKAMAMSALLADTPARLDQAAELAFQELAILGKI